MDNEAPPYVVEMVRRPYAGLVPVLIRGPNDVLPLLEHIRHEDREHFVAVLLNARHEVIGVETIHIGTISTTFANPREVFRAALLANATSLILAHNHPSGHSDPSEEDIQSSARIRAAGSMLGINVLDHIIVAANGATSLREGRHL